MSVRVVARIRPLLNKELDTTNNIIVRGDSVDQGKALTLVKIPNPKNEAEEFSFAFNSVYDQTATQEQLFNAEVSPHLKSLFQGLDVTIFAYGVTGTGKTHTMRGGLKLADRGVIPRLLSGIYRRGKKIAKDSGGDTTVDVALAYYEIYNDKVFDLFEAPEKRTPSGLPLREKDGKTIVVGLSERPCADLRDFERLYIEANANRVTAATKLNAHSSRSHAILRVKVTQTTVDAAGPARVRESTASAIDLAGSEDNRRTDNGRERLVESAAINKSLFVLSQCVDAIARGDRRVPYRESKMTRILSLGQNRGVTVMILNLAPLRSYHLDTLSSLNVSSRAKRIEVREIENEVVFKSVPPRVATAASGVGGSGQAGGGGTGASLARQPLRPLANVHNVHTGAIASKAAETARPVKAFNVYTDKAKPSAMSAPSVAARPLPNTQIRRSGSLKRPSDPESQTARPSKLARPTPGSQHLSLSAEQLEAIVEKKVSEILASRAAQEPPAAAPVPSEPAKPDISEAVQRRLDALERRIEGEERGDDARSDGLRFLLAAKQHRERGDDAAALRMYDLAQPFFPGQAKLAAKIERLRAKVGGDPAGAAAPGAAQRKRRRASDDDKDDDEYRAVDADNDDSVADVPRPKARRARPKPAAPEDGEALPPTPRAQRLLDIVNSRDVEQICALRGFRAKKALDLVEALGSAAGAESVWSLAQLRTVPGMGGRAVDRAYDGLLAV